MNRATLFGFLAAFLSGTFAIAASNDEVRNSLVDLEMQDHVSAPIEITIDGQEMVSAEGGMVNLDLVSAAGAPFEALWNPITFNHGVPVGGSASVKMWPDGNYQFIGHFHDSGATSYNDAIMFAVTGKNGYVLTFSHTGHVAGTFEPGSRDDNWNNSGHSRYIATHWHEFVGAGWTAKANTSLDLGSLWKTIKTGIGYIKEVVAIVGALG